MPKLAAPRIYAWDIVHLTSFAAKINPGGSSEVAVTAWLKITRPLTIIAVLL